MESNDRNLFIGVNSDHDVSIFYFNCFINYKFDIDFYASTCVKYMKSNAISLGSS
jgi:hypothetical protein